VDVDFPFWLRATHLFNLVLMGILVRSGWEILSSLPRLWWRGDSKPGTEWLRLTRRRLPTEEGVYTSLMDERSMSPLLALPGRENIGLGRHWHGLGVMLWVLNGLVYVILLFATGLWRRLIPTSWEVFPEAWESARIYLGLGVPSIEHFQPYDALQMLTYSAVIFLLAPLMILTGLAMSPAIRSRFPWYVKIFRNVQVARSLHFLCHAFFILFIVGHVGLVLIVHPEYNLPHMMLGIENNEPEYFAQAFTVALITIALVLAFWIGLSYWSLSDRARTQRLLVAATEPGRKVFLDPLDSRMTTQQVFTEKDISEFHWTNGLPPTEDESPQWLRHRDTGWEDWRLRVEGLDGEHLELSLEELKAMPRTEYIATHTCMQGWSATSKWQGVTLSSVLELLGPKPEEAEYVMIESHGLAQKMYDNRPREPFYAVIALRDLYQQDTILAYERNDRPLDLHLGAPLRLRVETNHGYKMVKWISKVQWLTDYSDIGDGRGGTREDSALQAFNGRI
jgi:thiosulfate reductase cytochrome b subunit